MSTNKARIAEYFKTDRTFEGGVKLYQELGPSMSFKNILNRQGHSKYNQDLLFEELRKVGGISPDELKTMISSQIIQKDKPVLSEEKDKFILELPVEIKKVFKLREEFPFLNQATCPNELKILVADMITKHDNYVKAHKRLFNVLSDKDYQEAAATVVEDYLENQQIWDELNHYKEKGEILGNSEVFSKANRLKEIREMKTADLHKLCNNLKSNITKVKKSLKEKPNDKKTADWTAKLENFQFELTEVNRLLGLNE